MVAHTIYVHEEIKCRGFCLSRRSYLEINRNEVFRKVNYIHKTFSQQCKDTDRATYILCGSQNLYCLFRLMAICFKTTHFTLVQKFLLVG